MSSDNIFGNSFQSVSNISTNVPYLNVSSQTVDKSKVNNLNVENNLVATNFNLIGDIEITSLDTTGDLIVEGILIAPNFDLGTTSVSNLNVLNISVLEGTTCANFNCVNTTSTDLTSIQNVVGDVVVNNNLNITDNILIEGLLSSDALNVTTLNGTTSTLTTTNVNSTDINCDNNFGSALCLLIANSVTSTNGTFSSDSNPNMTYTTIPTLLPTQVGYTYNIQRLSTNTSTNTHPRAFLNTNYKIDIAPTWQTVTSELTISTPGTYLLKGCLSFKTAVATNMSWYGVGISETDGTNVTPLNNSINFFSNLAGTSGTPTIFGTLSIPTLETAFVYVTVTTSGSYWLCATMAPETSQSSGGMQQNGWSWQLTATKIS